MTYEFLDEVAEDLGFEDAEDQAHEYLCSKYPGDTYESITALAKKAVNIAVKI